MTHEQREVTTVKDVYISYDGLEFTDKNKCLHHEWKLESKKVYMVSSRGQRSDTNEIYSTMELAQKAIGSSDIHTITEVHLNERFWRDD